MAVSDFWIIQPFNPAFCTALAFFLILLIVGTLIVRRKSDRVRRLTLVTACIVNIIIFIVYKYSLCFDEEYNVLRAGMGGFSIWGELPFHLCNINMILIPIAVLKKNRPLTGFCFFVAPIAAFMALAMPGAEFSGHSLFLPRMLGYYTTHFLIVIEGLSIVTFGLYTPQFRDLPKISLTTLLLAFIIFCFNLLLRFTGLYTRANYFFTIETEGNALLDIFYSWLPYPFLYIIPCTVILFTYDALVTSTFYLAKKAKKAFIRNR